MSHAFMPVENGAARDWFHRLVNAREDLASLGQARTWLELRLAQASLGAGDGPGEKADRSPRPARERPPGERADLLAFHAPLALLEGAWLQALAQPGNNQTPAVARLFAAYLALLGKDEAASPACAYRGWLNLSGLALGPATAWRFAHNPEVGEPALRFASLQLALGLHGAEFFPQVLGFTLAYLASASPWRLPALPSPRRQAVLQAMAEHAESAKQAFLAEGGDPARVKQGLALYQSAEASYLNELQGFARHPASWVAQVGEIFRRKRRFARGYHPKVQLGGRGLEDWFAEAPFDAQGFLAAFAASPYAQGRPGQRPFDRLAGFGGPMFGVFDREELALLDAWLEGAQTVPQSHSDLHLGEKPPLPNRPPRKFPPPQGGGALLPSPAHGRGVGGEGAKLEARSLFRRLITQDPGADTQAAAQGYVETLLARARRAIRRTGKLQRQFFDYSPMAFAERITRIHDQETALHRPFTPPPKLRREEYLWGLRQFAPAVLVDGCWLRHQGDVASQDNRIRRLLYRIYAEELGEGRTDWNHPKIYRDLLAGLGMDLPALETEAFARHPEFLDAAFDLPNYLLAISLFPRTYLAETLGLNLAIELSGLGHGYLRLAEELAYWQIDPFVVKLHLSIDNLAGGHAAMACEAIQLYLDEAKEHGGDAAVQAEWRRVWSGYLSLGSATRRFKRALVLGFCLRFLPCRLFPSP